MTCKIRTTWNMWRVKVLKYPIWTGSVYKMRKNKPDYDITYNAYEIGFVISFYFIHCACRSIWLKLKYTEKKKTQLPFVVCVDMKISISYRLLIFNLKNLSIIWICFGWWIFEFVSCTKIGIIKNVLLKTSSSS